MAHVKENDVTEGLSGRFGKKIVFRQLGNRTIAARRPRQGGEPTAEMVAHRVRFKSASAYAKAKMLDPVAKAEYEVMAKQYELTSAYAAAVADYLKLPEIAGINTARYTGTIGDVIGILCTDNFKIVAVQVSIVRANGTQIESGAGTLTPGDTEWKYRTTVANASLLGTIVKVVVTDKPGNTALQEKAL